MFSNKANDGKNNVCGKVIAEYRKEHNYSQREIADMMQLAGLDIDKNAVQRIESGERFVTDIEIRYFSKVLNISYEKLLNR